MLEYPKTLEEAKKARYGAWAGFPNGHKYESGKCAYEVWGNERGATGFQCRKKNGYGAENLYCKIHAQKLRMIEGPKPKPRRKSFSETLIDQIEALEKENAELKAQLKARAS